MENRYNAGDMVWGKVTTHPWWPGEVYDEAFASSLVLERKREGRFLVSFYGDNTYGWLDPLRLVPFEPHFNEKLKQTNDKAFLNAVGEAMHKFNRRAALGAACFCRNPSNFRPAGVWGRFFEVDVRGYEPGCIYSMEEIKRARDGFKPFELLSFVRQLALTPRSDIRSNVDFMKNAAQGIAYRNSVYAEIDVPYFQAFGVNLPNQQKPPLIREALLSGKSMASEGEGESKGIVGPVKVDKQKKKLKTINKRGDMPMGSRVFDFSKGSAVVGPSEKGASGPAVNHDIRGKQKILGENESLNGPSEKGRAMNHEVRGKQKFFEENEPLKGPSDKGPAMNPDIRGKMKICREIEPLNEKLSVESIVERQKVTNYSGKKLNFKKPDMEGVKIKTKEHTSEISRKLSKRPTGICFSSIEVPPRKLTKRPSGMTSSNKEVSLHNQPVRGKTVINSSGSKSSGKRPMLELTDQEPTPAKFQKGNESGIDSKITKKPEGNFVQEPTMLIMSFPPEASLPSITELNTKFVRFLTFDITGTRVFWKSSTCKVLFRDKLGAELAYNHAVQNRLLGHKKVKYWLKTLKNSSPPRLPELSQNGSEKLHLEENFSVPPELQLKWCLKKPENAETEAVCPNPKSTPEVQLKSCLKKPENAETGIVLVNNPYNHQNPVFEIDHFGAASSSSCPANGKHVNSLEETRVVCPNPISMPEVQLKFCQKKPENAETGRMVLANNPHNHQNPVFKIDHFGASSSSSSSFPAYGKNVNSLEETRVVCTNPISISEVQLKSCLKKPENAETGIALVKNPYNHQNPVFKIDHFGASSSSCPLTGNKNGLEETRVVCPDLISMSGVHLKPCLKMPENAETGIVLVNNPYIHQNPFFKIDHFGTSSSSSCPANGKNIDSLEETRVVCPNLPSSSSVLINNTENRENEARTARDTQTGPSELVDIREEFMDLLVKCNNIVSALTGIYGFRAYLVVSQW